MLKEAKGFGETIEEAYEEAKNNLALLLADVKFNEDDIQLDVVSLPKKKTLGLFGGSKAEVRAFIELPDQKKKPSGRTQKTEKPRAEKPVRENKHTDKTAAEPKEDKNIPAADSEKAVALSELKADSRALIAANYLADILNRLGCENVEIKVAERETGASLFLSGDGLGVVIGRRGETLDALQYLASLSANSANGYYKVTINIGDYRQRREQALTGLAKRMASQVLRSGRRRSLEPMNPYERRIIHTVIQEIEGVTSNSVGEGSSRRVVISPENGGNAPRRRNDRPARTEADAAREPKKDVETALYGKIN